MSNQPEKDFTRDKHTKALINKNRQAYVQYKNLKARNERINRLEEEMTEIKSMLRELLDRK